jgi:hypothetical protein
MLSTQVELNVQYGLTVRNTQCVHFTFVYKQYQLGVPIKKECAVYTIQCLQIHNCGNLPFCVHCQHVLQLRFDEGVNDSERWDVSD